MARQVKTGLDYFSHDVNLMQDKKIRLIFAKHGINGIFIYERLVEECYKEKGYFLKTDEDFNILFCGDYKLNYNVYIEILNDYIERDLFNKKLFNKYNILTSERIQKNYISGTERRKEVNFIKEYLLLSPKEMYSEKVSVNINKLNVDINSLNTDISTQSKVKESKEKESKENNNDYLYLFLDELSNLYPNKKGKPSIKKSLSKLKELHKTSLDQWNVYIDRYTRTKEEWRAFKDFSTFVNGAYLEFTDEEWTEPAIDINTYNFKTQEEKRYYMALDMKKKDPINVKDSWLEEKRLEMEASFA